jgi:hypothetical protein
VVEAFTASVHRHVDVEALTDDLTRVVVQTLEPAAVGLWLPAAREDAQGRGSAAS